jgi:hypothetical protein
VTPYYDDGTCVIYHGDCREVMSMSGIEVHATVTSRRTTWPWATTSTTT